MIPARAKLPLLLAWLANDADVHLGELHRVHRIAKRATRQAARMGS